MLERGHRIRMEEQIARRRHQSVDVMKRRVMTEHALCIKDGVGAARRDSHDADREAPHMMAQTNARDGIRKSDQTVHLVPRVTREPLIGSLTSQSDLESLPMHLAREHQRGRRRRVDDWGLRGADQLGVGMDEILLADPYDRRPRSDVTRDEGRLAALVVPRAGHLHCERRRRRAADPGCHGRNDARVDPAADITNDGHVGAETLFDRGKQRALEISATSARCRHRLPRPRSGKSIDQYGRSSTAARDRLEDRCDSQWPGCSDCTPAKHVEGPGTAKK